MKNLFKNTEFVFGVTKYKDLPDDQGFEILLAGRSNAGKSAPACGLYLARVEYPNEVFSPKAL